MSIGIQILSNNFNNHIADITFYPDTGGTVNLGTHLIPYTTELDYVYGSYELYFSEDNRTCYAYISNPNTDFLLQENFSLILQEDSSGILLSGNSIVSDGLTLKLDANNPSSYPGSGSVWYDIAGTQQNVTLVNSPIFTSAIPSYFTFSGSYGTGSGGVLPTTGYTKSVWFYLNSYTDNNLVSKEGQHYMFFAGTNKLYSGHANWVGFPTNYPSTASFSLNTWYNVTLTFNTTDGMTLYINGVFDSSYTAIKTAFVGDGSINVASYGLGNLLDGRISIVYCYDRSLTSTEVLQNFNFDKSQFGL